MNYEDQSRTLNHRMSNDNPGWNRASIWDRAEDGAVAPVHLLYSALLAIIQGSVIEWTFASVENPDDRESPYEAVVITPELVVRAVRSTGEIYPVVSVHKRAALEGFELLTVPLLTQDDWGFSRTDASARLTYPGFSVVITARDGQRLIDALPAIIADL